MWWFHKDDEDGLMHANQAAEKTKKARLKLKAKSIKLIMNEIDHAIARGQNSADIGSSFFKEGVDKFFEELGYIISAPTEPTQWNQYLSMRTISWGAPKK
jgi:hypothetical protein